MRYAINIDDFTNEVFGHLERNQDGQCGHRAVFESGDRDGCVDRATASLRKLVDQMMYLSDECGYPKRVQ